jgi:large subunit ribosomal protein L25
MAPARAPYRTHPSRAATPLIMASDTTSLSLTARAPEGSRSARRLRRDGLVPGVIYGGDGGPEHFAVDARILRNTLAHSGAILEVTIDGGTGVPVLVKDLQRHPVRGETVHVDLLRVNMSETIQTTVHLELTGAEEAPGSVEGGVLNQETRELNIEALPGDIPDSITFDVSKMEMNATVTLSELTAPEGVTFLDDPEETVLATITPPTLEPVEEEIETETALVGEDGEPLEGEELEAAKAEAEAQAEGDTGEEAEQQADSDSEES